MKKLLSGFNLRSESVTEIESASDNHAESDNPFAMNEAQSAK